MVSAVRATHSRAAPLCALTSRSIRPAASLKLAARSATSSLPSTATRAPRLPAPHSRDPALQTLEAARQSTHDRIGADADAEREQREYQNRTRRRRPSRASHQQGAAVGEREPDRRSARRHHMVLGLGPRSPIAIRSSLVRAMSAPPGPRSAKSAPSAAMPVIERGLLHFRRGRGRRQELAGQLRNPATFGGWAFTNPAPRRHREHREQRNRHDDRQPDAPVEPMDAMTARRQRAPARPVLMQLLPARKE